jgi:hypothetical protein
MCIPDKFKTKKMCIEAIERWSEFLDRGDEGYEFAFKYVPKKYKTVELCWAALKTQCYEEIYMRDIIDNIPEELLPEINSLFKKELVKDGHESQSLSDYLDIDWIPDDE